jgi:hypothetical protein
MDDLVDEITSKTGLGRPAAEKALGIIVSFLEREGPTKEVAPMIDKLPGARALAEAHGGRGAGLFAVFNDLSAAGLGMGQIQTVVGAFIGFAKSKLGERDVDSVIRAIPSIGQFI